MYALFNNVPIIFSDGEDYQEKCEMYIYNFNTKPNIFTDYSTRNLYYRDINSLLHLYNKSSIIYDGTDIPTLLLKLIMNKYLKYKYKYLKLTNKALIYNSLHDKNYNDIYDKYKKYKYKYLQIKN